MRQKYGRVGERNKIGRKIAAEIRPSWRKKQNRPKKCGRNTAELAKEQNRPKNYGRNTAELAKETK